MCKNSVHFSTPHSRQVPLTAFAQATALQSCHIRLIWYFSILILAFSNNVNHRTSQILKVKEHKRKVVSIICYQADDGRLIDLQINSTGNRTVYSGSIPGRVKPNTIKIDICSFPAWYSATEGTE